MIERAPDAEEPPLDPQQLEKELLLAREAVTCEFDLNVNYFNKSFRLRFLDVTFRINPRKQSIKNLETLKKMWLPTGSFDYILSDVISNTIQLFIP